MLEVIEITPLTLGGIIGAVISLNQVWKIIVARVNGKYVERRKSEQNDEQHEKIMELTEKQQQCIEQLKESNEIIKSGLKELLKDDLRERHKEHMSNGYITTSDIDDYEKQYKAYHALGGNGTGTRCYNDVLGLPIRD